MEKHFVYKKKHRMQNIWLPSVFYSQNFNLFSYALFDGHKKDANQDLGLIPHPITSIFRKYTPKKYQNVTLIFPINLQKSSFFRVRNTQKGKSFSNFCQVQGDFCRACCIFVSLFLSLYKIRLFFFQKKKTKK